MSIENELKKEGIEVIHALDTLTINLIASKVASVLVDCLPDQSLDYQTLFIKLSRCHMYTAKFSEGTAKAKYFYRNSSIYFQEDINFEDLNTFILHECIHRIQEHRDSRNNLLSLGLCDFTNPRLPGMGLNEAAVQLLTTKCFKHSREPVKYFGISLETYSPEYYPLECALVSQMAYLIGEDLLYKSTLLGTKDFQEAFIKATSKKVYTTIEKQIDQIIFAEDELATLYARTEHMNVVDTDFVKITHKIEKLKDRITNTFMQTQTFILTSYFEQAFQQLYTPKAIERYRNQLYHFKHYIGSIDNNHFYNQYYVEKMVKLEQKYIELEQPISTSLVPAKTSLLHSIFEKITHILKLSNHTEKEEA